MNVMKTFRRLKRGAGYSEKYGRNHGTTILAILVALGAVAGADKGLVAALICAGVMLAVFGPVWLIGCWETGGTDERNGSRAKGESA